MINRPQLLIKARFEELSLNFSKELYDKLLHTKENLFLDLKEESPETLQTIKTGLFENASKISELWRRTRATHVWERYTGILSGPYLYFFRNQMDLQPTTYQYVRNAVVRCVDSGLLGRRNVFVVEGRSGGLYLSCEVQSDMDSWIEALMRTQINIRRLRRENRRVREQEQEDQKNPDRCLLGLEFELQSLKVTLFEKDLKKTWLEYYSSDLKVKIQSFSYQFKLSLELRTIHVRDSLREYCDKKLQKLISCNGNQKDVGFLKLDIETTDPKHPKYNKVDSSVQLDLGEFEMNFKPDTLLKLIDCFKSETKSANTNHVSTRNIATFEENNLLEQDIINFSLRIFMKKVSLNMVHRKNHLAIAECIVSEILLIIKSKQQEFDLDLELKNLQFIDCTNYPQTLHLESQFELSQRRELLGVDFKNQIEEKNSLIKASYRGFSAGSSLIKDKVWAKLEIEINFPKVDLALQPIYRIIDYIYSQIVAVFTNPEVFDENSMEKTKNLKDRVQETEETQSFPSPEDFLQEIDHQTYFSIEILMKNPRIYIKANKDSSEYLIFDLGLISFKNARELVVRSSSQQSLHCTVYRLWMKDMGIRAVSGHKNSPIELSLPFHFNLEIESPTYPTEYKQNFPDQDWNLSRKIKARIFPIILSLSRADYLLIMRLLYSNIWFDDLMDQFHYHSVPEKIPSSPLKLQRNTTVNLMNQKPTLEFQLDIDNITVFLMIPQGNFDLQTPLARVCFDSLRVTFLKRSGDLKSIQVFGDKLRGTYFEESMEYSLFGDFKAPEYSDVTSFCLSDLSPEFLRLKGKEYTKEFISEEVINTENPNLTVIVMISPTGHKDVEVSLDTVKVNCQAGVLMSLSRFAIMDSSVNPPEPIGKKEEEIDIIIYDHWRMTVSVNIKNILLMVSCLDNQHPLALAGNAYIDLDWQSSKTIEELKSKTAELRETPDYNPSKDFELNPVLELKTKLQEFEIFICHYDELINNKRSLKKRNILLPSKMYFEMNKYLVLMPSQFFIAKHQNKLELEEKLTLKISYQDVRNLQNIINYQKGTIYLLQSQELNAQTSPKNSTLESPKSGKRLKSVANKVKDKIKVSSVLLKTKPETSIKNLTSSDILGNASRRGDIMRLSDTTFEIVTKDMEVVLVADLGDAFVPIVILNFLETQSIIKSNLLLLTVLVPMSISISYFNPQAAHWEPILEKAELMLELTTQTFHSPGFELKLSSKETEGALLSPINLNISSQMVNVLLKSVRLLTIDRKESRIGFKKEVSMMENRIEIGYDEEEKENRKDEIEESEKENEHISPYSLKNETGYEIEVCDRNSGGGVYKLENGETVNLEMEFNKRDFYEIQQNETKISLEIKRTFAKYPAIKELDLTRVRVTRYLLKEENEEDFAFLICNVGLDKESNRRLIAISSELVFQNRTKRDMVIRILVHEEKGIELVLPKMGWIPIPVDLVRKQILIRFRDGGVWSNRPYSLAKFLTNHTDNIYEIPLMVGEAEKNSFILASVEKEARGYGKTVVYFDPPFAFRNCLPINLEFKLKSINFDEKNYKLKPQEICQEFDVSIFEKLWISLKVTGFQWSKLQKLFEPNSEDLCQIVIQDYEKNEANINLFHSKSYTGPQIFIFYVKTYIVNETNYDLCFIGIENAGKKEKNMKKSILPCQKISPLIKENFIPNQVNCSPKNLNKNQKEDQSPKSPNDPSKSPKMYKEFEDKNPKTSQTKSPKSVRIAHTPKALNIFEEGNQNLILLSEFHVALEIIEKTNEDLIVSKPVSLQTIGDSEVEIKTKYGVLNLGVSIRLLCVGKITILQKIFLFFF